MILSQQAGKGPLTLAHLRDLVESGTIAWTDLAFHPSTGKWERLYEIAELASSLPKAPSPELLRSLEGAGGSAPVVRPAPRIESARPVSNAVSPNPVSRVDGEPAASPGPSGAAIHETSPTGRAWIDSLTLAASARRNLQGRSAYYILIEGREIGPIDLSDLDRAYQSARRLPASAYAWRDGMRRWRLFAAIPELARFTHGSEQARSARVLHEPELVIERVHRRKSERKPMIAHICRIGKVSGRQMIGVCGDVSVDGFQLIQEIGALDFPAGSLHRLEVCPMKLMNVPRLTLDAVVRWNDRASGCVGFEFKAIDAASRERLYEYLFGKSKKIA